jgi:hypothetical protein
MPFEPNYFPHPAQKQIHAARRFRFRMVCTGRRFGKTLCLAAELLDQGGGRLAGDYGWVAPTYNVAERGLEAFEKIAGGYALVCGRNPARVEFMGPLGKVKVWFLSADNPDNIRGYGFNGLVIDEAAAIPADVWNYVLRPTISQTLGWAVFCSTPKGRNWFYDLHTRGQDPAETLYKSFTFSSRTSPFFPPAEWDEARRTLPSDVFRQEYAAEFLEDSAGVFRNVGACLVDDALCRLPHGRRQILVGCDVAKHSDWTVLIAMDAESGLCLAKERFNNLEWPVQKERIAAFCRAWRGRLMLDATGVGDPIYDDLRQVLPDIEGVKLSSASKTMIVQRLMVAVEQRRISWPRSWEDLTNEMGRFEYTIMPSGAIQYAAPSGYHDDCVMALALANHGRAQFEGAGNMRAVGMPIKRVASGWADRRRERVLDA